MKTGCIISIVGLVVLLLLAVVVAAAAGFFLLRGPAPQPLVLISSPRNGERVAVNQDTAIHATARGDQKIKRIELWVDGKLLDGQTTNIAGGLVSFPLAVNWRPAISGTHVIDVRAYNVQNSSGRASINVQAVQSGDRDGDTMLDALDGCPDQPGLTTNNGCPEPGRNDRDGDGAADITDQCPDQAGTLLAQGCPDADGDGIADASDACPGQPGTAELNGCPSPGDGDSDTVLDTADACPSEAGSAALGGCPDRDGDGVRDALDFCPDVPGTVSNNGCPAGDPGGGGGDVAGGGGDRDTDGRPDDEEAGDDPFGGFNFWLGDLYILVPVEIQALEFRVDHDYSEVYCYATLGSTAERIGPFESMSARSWDIAAFMGPLNSRTVGGPLGGTLQVGLDCSGLVYGSRESPTPGEGFGDAGGDDAYFGLGAITRSHTIGNNMVEEVTVDSSGGTSGHNFHAKYRVCSPACQPSALRPPMLSRGMAGGQNRLVWTWEGNAYDISGFKLYVNGAFVRTLPPNHRNFALSNLPPCGETLEYRLTAYRGNAGHPDAESTRSNTATWEGPPCKRTVVVEFLELHVDNLPDNDDWGNVGPLFGELYAGEEHRWFEDAERIDHDRTTHNISNFYPRTEFTVELDVDEPLVIGASIKDRDPGLDPNDTLFDKQEIIPSSQVVSGPYHMTSSRGSSEILVSINVLP